MKASKTVVVLRHNTHVKWKTQMHTKWDKDHENRKGDGRHRAPHQHSHTGLQQRVLELQQPHSTGHQLTQQRNGFARAYLKAPVWMLTAVAQLHRRKK